MKTQLQKVLILFICWHFTQSTFGQIIKKGLYFPDAGIYKVLKCDFHTHTVFSDGDLWPNRRLLEAASEDIDALSITDHIEYTPKAGEFKEINHNRSYELAKNDEKTANIMLVGHSKAVFKLSGKDETPLFKNGDNLKVKINNIYINAKQELIYDFKL